MLCRLRFLTYVLMLVPSNVSMPNGFTNICLIPNTRFFINLARWVRVLIFQRKQTFNFLNDPLCSHFKLLIDELIQLWQESFSTISFCEQYGNSTNIDSFTISRSASFRYWILTISVQFYTNLREFYFACIFPEYLKTNVVLVL